MDRLKIIAVDDQPENLQLLVHMLKDDYAVIASTSGETAIELAQRHNDAALILLDVFMPSIDGFEVLSRLKSDPKTSHLPVIFVTGNDNESDYQKGFELGAYDFVLKPISASLLTNRIKHCLASTK
ncbi:response regulator [Vibrio amylolyticus]|uniref:response regulator n=1 Tax=Vibrio TaxID=662 RepID=UPI000C85592F|nr:response regulator [Vibrio sp. 10N.261.55.A7]PMK02141.1 hypothetical protein BCU12_02890 [Vibrio sp. 10N.261.55.A7]